MEKEILNFIESNKEDMAKNDFDTFFESDEYNNIKDKDSRRTIFYMTTFLMSTKEYKEFGEIIKEFIKITGAINGNEYLQKTHECYEELICNFLKKIKQLLTSDDIYENKNENIFIKNLNELVDEIDNIFYPPNLELNTIKKEWKRIYDELLYNKDKIKNNIKKFERYTKKLSKYIEKLEHKEKVEQSQNNINDNDFKIIYNSSIYNNNDLNNYEINKNYVEEDEKEEIEQLKIKQETVEKVISNEMIPTYFSNENNKKIINEGKNRINNEAIKISDSSKENIKNNKKINKNNKDIQNQNLNNGFQNCFVPIPSNNPKIYFMPVGPMPILNNINGHNQPILFFNNFPFNMNNNNQYINNKK